MNKIKIKFVDFWGSFNENDNDFINILKKHFDVEITETPDFIFYSNFGSKHLKYNCIRIFFTGEAIVPDFNECDYALGFDEIDYSDRYIRMPLYALFQYSTLLNIAKTKKKLLLKDISEKKFCSFVCSNWDSRSPREKIFNEISKYKKIDSGGRYNNNVGGPVKDKLAFQKEYKFSIASENCSYPGYTTEKIIDSFAANTIPIYWGNPNIEKEFNPKAFINANNYNLEDLVKVIKELDSNDEKYLAMINEPVFKNEQIINYQRRLEEFLLNIFTQDPINVFRRPLGGTCILQENYKKIFFRFLYKPYNFFISIRSIFKKIFKIMGI